jgi:hypothetical protein
MPGSIYTPNSFFTLDFHCLRGCGQVLSFVFHFNNGTLTKIGQYPSFADLATSEIEKYRKILRNYYLEFRKAIGLAAHDVGIGAFVYLRRIFESLIEEKHQEAMNLSGWDEDIYTRSRMDEKISLLKKLLPEVLVDNKVIYFILSKGIHELSEKECLAVFPIVKTGIELILDEKIEKQERERKINEAKKAIQSLSDSMKNSESGT